MKFTGFWNCLFFNQKHMNTEISCHTMFLISLLRYFKAVFWRENRVLKKMKERLLSNWMQKNFHRVSLTIMSGIACRKSCFANSRDCLCGQYIIGQVTENCFVMEFGGRKFVGNYVIQEQSVWHALQELMTTKTHIFKDIL